MRLPDTVAAADETFALNSSGIATHNVLGSTFRQI
jgi:hypothetical protein